MPGANTYPWDWFEKQMWVYCHKGIISETETWEILACYWVALAI